MDDKCSPCGTVCSLRAEQHAGSVMATGNSNEYFWMAHSSYGKKPKFETADQLWDACEQYFKWVEDNPLYEDKAFNSKNGPVHAPIAKKRAMTKTGLCVFLDVPRTTFNDIFKRGPDFQEVHERVDLIIRTQKFEGAAADLLNPALMAKDLGLVDKSERVVDNQFAGVDALTMARAVLAVLNSAAEHGGDLKPLPITQKEGDADER